MKPIFEERYHNLLQALNTIDEMDVSMLRRAEQAIIEIESAIQQLKQFAREHLFTDVLEEIAFYKDTLPMFQSLFIYYANIFRIERNLPAGEKEERLKVIRKERKKIRTFLAEHKDFVTYYELSKSYQDILYFTKQYDTEQRWQLLDIYAFGVDENSCTRYSLLLSTVLAYKKLYKYLQQSTVPEDSSVITPVAPNDDMTWDAPTIWLAEMIIGIHVNRVLKNKNMPLAKVSRFVCRMFGKEPINIHKAKEELRIRKKSNTPYTDFTRVNLLRYWDEEDLHAL